MYEDEIEKREVLLRLHAGMEGGARWFRGLLQPPPMLDPNPARQDAKHVVVQSGIRAVFLVEARHKRSATCPIGGRGE